MWPPARSLLMPYLGRSVRKETAAQGVPHLVPLFAHQAAGEESLRIQPAQQVEGQLQRKEAQEITLEERLQSIGQMTQLRSTT